MATLTFSDVVPYDFHLFWPNPVMAHINVPVDFRFSAYEKDNQPLVWSLGNAPAWMSIDQYGRIIGTPTVRDTIGVTVTVTVTRPSGVPTSISRNFIVRVYNSDAPNNDTKFRFVSPTGSNVNLGSKSSPWLTIEYGWRQTISGFGQTLMVRGGTYAETWNWEQSGIIAPSRNKFYSPTDPFELRGYPGETAILETPAGQVGHGFWLYTTKYSILSNLTARNMSKRANFLMTSAYECVVKDCHAYDANWSYTDNCTGVWIGGASNLLDRVVSRTNYDRVDRPTFNRAGPTAGPSWNTNNFLYFGEDANPADVPLGSPLTNWTLNCKGYTTESCFKIKHATQNASFPVKFVFHNCEAFDALYGFDIGSIYASARHCIAHDCNYGICFFAVDPSGTAYHPEWGPIFVERNTLVDNTYSGFANRGDLTFYNRSNGSYYKRNIAYSSLGVPTSLTRRLFMLWASHAYGEASAVQFDSEMNVFWNTTGSDTGMILLGTGASSDKNLTAWRALGHDLSGKFQNPLFINPANDFSIPVGSPADWGSGDYSGALRPGIDYGVIGTLDTNRVEFQIPSGGEPPPLPPAWGAPPSGRRKICGCLELG